MSRIAYVLRAALFAIGLATSFATSAEDYFINPGDVLTVDIWGEEDLSREVLVRPDGNISLPMAGEVVTTGRTLSDVGKIVSQALSNYMKDAPEVVVSLKSSDGNKIYVIGKVEKPGEFKIGSATDVVQALALAGGLNSFAAENEIIILRRQPDGKQVGIPFRYARVKTGKDLSSNIILQSRDVVVVP